MTEKERFILCNKTTDSNVWDILEKQCYSWEYVVSLLNEQDKIIQELKSYLLHMGYKPIQHDDGHISLKQIEIKKMEIRNGLLDGWIE